MFFWGFLSLFLFWIFLKKNRYATDVCHWLMWINERTTRIEETRRWVSNFCRVESSDNDLFFLCVLSGWHLSKSFLIYFLSLGGRLIAWFLIGFYFIKGKKFKGKRLAISLFFVSQRKEMKEIECYFFWLKLLVFSSFISAIVVECF